MLNLTLTPDADTASGLARVTTNSTGVTLVRADQNGTVPVRLQEGQGVESGVLQVRDYEGALVGPLTYIATTTAPAEVRRNLHVNPRVATTASSFASATVSGSRQTLAGSSDASFTYRATSDTAASGARIYTTMPNLVIGQTYAVSALVERLGAPHVVYVATSTNNTGQQTLAANATGTALEEISGTFTATAVTMYLHVRLSNTASVPTTRSMTRILVEQAATPGTFFDGATPGAEWVGNANISASIIRAIETVEVSTNLNAVASDMVSVVAMPQYNAAARVTVGQSFARPTKSIRHDIIGRPDPVFTLRRGGFRTGTIRAMVSDLNAYDLFDGLQQQAAVCLFRFAAHEQGGRAAVDFYAVIEDLSSDTAEGTRALDLTLRVAEVRRPSGFLLGALGWDYAALAGRGHVYAALPATYGTYADLAIGEAS